MHLNATYKNSWNRKQNKVSVTVDSDRRKLAVLTDAISGNVVGGFGEFGEYTFYLASVLSSIYNTVEQRKCVLFKTLFER